MNADWSSSLTRWTEAGLIDAKTAVRIRAFELSQAGSGRLRWPILIALAFGALMIGGGVLLFVAANWQALSPAQRFALVLLLVSGFHVAGSVTATRFDAMSVALHALGTVSLGAGIALAGQIFNLDEHWPGGIMLWAAGAAIAWAVLRQTPQLILVATLVPAWLAGEWIVVAGNSGSRVGLVLAAGVFLLALTYMTAVGPEKPTHARRALLWLGAVSTVVSAPALAMFSWEGWWGYNSRSVSLVAVTIALTVAFGGPLILASFLRRTSAWVNGLATVWVSLLFFVRPAFGGVAVYAWWALGAIGLVAWGLRDSRAERINLGAMFFAATVLTFYFSQVMDKLGRSASLVGLGLLFLGGGWALERMRRRLVEQTREAP
jgi:uncharacterized membrane protein